MDEKIRCDLKKERGLSSPQIDVEESGQESPRSVEDCFFNPYKKIDVIGNSLPHWQQGEVFVFVTWRLADSLPLEKLTGWKAEREAWMLYHPQPWNEVTEQEYNERFSRRIDDWLDLGTGSCILRISNMAKIMADALRYFDGERYELMSFVVMPNHVHVLFRPLEAYCLADIVKSWKGFTAKALNIRLGKTGQLWQNNYWDRLIRSEKHLFKCNEYIRMNPVKAKLSVGDYILFEKSVDIFKKRMGLENPISCRENNSKKEKGLSSPRF